MSEPAPTRRTWLLGAAAGGAAAAGAPWLAAAQDETQPSAAAAAAPAPFPLLTLGGRLIQGGFLVGRVSAPSPVRIDDADVPVGANGAFVTGFDRDAPAAARLEIGEGAARIGVDLPVEARTYVTGETIATTRSLFGGGVDEPSLLDDLVFDPDDLDDIITAEIAAQGPATRSLGGAGANADELRTRITREWRLKQDALASRAQLSGFLETFLWPLAGERRVTSAWGTARNYSNGTARPHYGVDLAAAIGTPVRAPAAGLVTLAEPDMYYEGGCVFIDHGLGLTSIYLHMNEVVATAGQVIAQGAPIGEVGTKGRSTGPHLCWRLYWRDRRLDPSLMTA